MRLRFAQNLKSVTIPSSVQTIGENAFHFGLGGENKQLVELHYTGTQEQWDKLAKENDFKNKNPLLYKPENFDCAHTVSFYCGNQAEGTSKVEPKVVQYEKLSTNPMIQQRTVTSLKVGIRKKMTVNCLISPSQLRKM